MCNGHLQLYLFFMVFKFQLLILSSFFLAFFIYDLKAFDDIFKADHLVQWSLLDGIVLFFKLLYDALLLSHLAFQRQIFWLQYAHHFFQLLILFVQGSEFF